MADLLLAAAPPAPVADAVTEADLDALLDAVTAIKAQQKELDQQLEPLLESLNPAMATGRLDPSFSHNDWAFAHSTGRLSYEFPPVVQQIEQQLRRNTITLGSDPAIELVGLNIDWQQNPPLIRARVRVTDPQLPTHAQVAAVQEFINRQQAPRRYRLLVQRTAVELIGPETAPNPAALQNAPDSP